MTRSATTATLGLVVVAIAGMVLMTPVSAVRVVQSDGSILACHHVPPGTPLALHFTHSMYGGEVTERWITTGHALERQEVLTDNAAAAEYYAWDGRVERAGDRFRVVTTPLRESALVVRVDQVGRHRLTIDTTTFDLATMVIGSTQARIEPVSVPIWQGTPC